MIAAKFKQHLLKWLQSNNRFVYDEITNSDQRRDAGVGIFERLLLKYDIMWSRQIWTRQIRTRRSQLAESQLV